jgi:hypothetical protein
MRIGTGSVPRGPRLDVTVAAARCTAGTLEEGGGVEPPLEPMAITATAIATPASAATASAVRRRRA